MKFITVTRWWKKLHYYKGHADDVAGSCDFDYVDGVELEVYVGTWDGQHPQVVIATELPPPGKQEETFTLVFRGPRAMAIEIFEGHVGMLP